MRVDEECISREEIGFVTPSEDPLSPKKKEKKEEK